jgi:hypothetical protein
VAWNNQGGDWFDKNNAAQGAEPYDSVTFSIDTAPDNEYIDFDVTELVQAYVDGTYENTGFFIKANGASDGYIAFYNFNHPGVDQRPKLSIIHTPNVEPEHQAPVLDVIGDKSVDIFSLLEFTLAVTDPDGDKLTFSATGLPGGASFDTTTHTFSWIPEEGQEGSYQIHFEVTDGYTADTEDVSITVNYVSRAPEIESFSPGDGAVFNENDTIQIRITASDPMNKDLSYVISIDGETKSTDSGYDCKTDYFSAGNHTIDVKVSNGVNEVVQQHVITVVNIYPSYDVNEDGVVDILDVTLVVENYGTTTTKPYPRYDINADGIVDVLDLDCVASHFGEIST